MRHLAVLFLALVASSSSFRSTVLTSLHRIKQFHCRYYAIPIPQQHSQPQPVPSTTNDANSSEIPSTATSCIESIETRIQQAYMRKDLETVRRCFLDLSAVDIVALYGTVERRAFNVALSPYLKDKSIQDIEALCQTLCLSYPYNVSADTFNTFLVEMLSNRESISTAEEMLQKFVFESPCIKPSIRTFNLLMQYFVEHLPYPPTGNTIALQSIRKYKQYISQYQLQPDSVSYSIFARSSQNASELSDIFEIVQNERLLNAPLFRCILESYGAIGRSDIALSIAQAFNENEDFSFRISHNQYTGDSLVAAAVKATRQMNLHNEMNTSTSVVIVNQVLKMLSEDKFLQISTKGYCLLFYYLSNQVRNKSQKLEDLKSAHAMLWDNFKKYPKFSSAIDQGKVLDAAIRFFLDDFKLALAYWTNEIIPFIHQSIERNDRTKLASDDKNELLYSALTAFIFVAGSANRPDEALAIAKAFTKLMRKGAYNKNDATYLYKSYSNGKKERNGSHSVILVPSIWENLLKIELFQL